MFKTLNVLFTVNRGLHVSPVNNHIIHMTRLRVVDNSEIGVKAMSLGRPPKCIHVYNKTGIGRVGDSIMVAILGEKHKAVIVGCKQKQSPFVARFDTNNIVLIDDSGNPLGTRILTPIPYILRTILKEKTFKKKADFTKVLAIASKFV